MAGVGVAAGAGCSSGAGCFVTKPLLLNQHINTIAPSITTATGNNAPIKLTGSLTISRCIAGATVLPTESRLLRPMAGKILNIGLGPLKYPLRLWRRSSCPNAANFTEIFRSLASRRNCFACRGGIWIFLPSSFSSTGKPALRSSNVSATGRSSWIYNTLIGLYWSRKSISRW